MLLKGYEEEMDLSEQDTVLIGTVEPLSPQDIDLGRAVKQKGAMVIVFSSLARHSETMIKGVDHFIDNLIPTDDSIVFLEGTEEKALATAAIASMEKPDSSEGFLLLKEITITAAQSEKLNIKRTSTSPGIAG